MRKTVNTEPQIDDYLAAVPEERVEALHRLRDTCAEYLVGFTEAFRYGMPCYERDGEPEVAFASQKQYISFYIMREDVLALFRDQLSPLSVGKGCIRYRRADQIDWEIVRGLLEATVTSEGEIC